MQKSSVESSAHSGKEETPRSASGSEISLSCGHADNTGKRRTDSTTKKLVKELYELATVDCQKVSRFFESKPFQLNDLEGGSSSFVESSVPLLPEKNTEKGLAASCDILEDDKEYPEVISIDVEDAPIEVELQSTAETKDERISGEEKIRVPKRKSNTRRLDSLVEKKME